MEQVIEVRYAGIVVGQATAVRDRTPTGVFVSVSDPLPVGTILSLKIGDQLTDGRVEHVVESSESTQVGMRVRFVDNRSAAAGGPSVAAAAVAPAAPASAAPVVAPAAPVALAPAPSAAVRMPPAATRVPPAATPLESAPSAPEPPTSAAPSEEAAEGESERIPGVSDLADSGPQNLAGGGGRRRRRRR